MADTMFCFQCEQTAGGKGCTRIGVCGKTTEVASLQDLLLYQLKGIGYYGQRYLEKGNGISPDAQMFVLDALFSTLTNVNFDPDRFVPLLAKAQEVKDFLRGEAGDPPGAPPEAVYRLPDTTEAMLADAERAGVMYDKGLDEDIRSLRETLMYGLKGMSAYAHHAAVLGQTSDEVNNYAFKVLDALTDGSRSVGDLVGVAMEFGQVNLKCMELLDRANTDAFGNPEPTQVLVTRKKGPFIIVSGHDLEDLRMLLEQTAGKGINIYTHGEMLPAHSYPELKKHKHLVGNYGGAWQEQQREFDAIPGSILMTTNCIQKPRDSYRDRLFTTSIVGWPEVAHIPESNGAKDFAPIIQKALALGGWSEDEPEKAILVGFGHHATLSHAAEVIDAVKQGAIKHFFLVGGCDGAKAGRNYFAEFAEKAPKDTVILTLGCGKYRFNKKEFGTIGGLPRLLDMGQCNDAYSAIKVAGALAGAFGCGVNDLPLTLVLSWYEQKAVGILLTLLSMGVKNIYIGPSLPAFISPNVLQTLVEKFSITPISNVESDMKAILG